MVFELLGAITSGVAPDRLPIALQLSPPLVLLNTPSDDVPAYMTLESLGSIASDTTLLKPNSGLDRIQLSPPLVVL